MNITLLRLCSEAQLPFCDNLDVVDDVVKYIYHNFDAVDDVVTCSAISVTALVGLLTFVFCCGCRKKRPLPLLALCRKKRRLPVKKCKAIACHVEPVTCFVNLFAAGTSMSKIYPTKDMIRLVSFKLAGKMVLTIVVGDLRCLHSYISYPNGAIVKASGEGFSQLKVNCDFQAGVTDDCDKDETPFRWLLGSAYSSALDMAKKEKLKQVAFPLFSIGEEVGIQSEKDRVAIGMKALHEWATKTTAEGGYHLTDVVWVADKKDTAWTMIMAAMDVLSGSVKASIV